MVYVYGLGTENLCRRHEKYSDLIFSFYTTDNLFLWENSLDFPLVNNYVVSV